MFLLCLLIGLETPLKIPRILLTTPIHSYSFSSQLDTPEDFFLSYPSLEIADNDSLYFKGSSNVLILLNGVPISNLKDVPLPSIEKIEVVAQDVSSLYGDYDAVINIIPKSVREETPYSKVKLCKNPNHVELEFGRDLFKGLDLYLTGDLDSASRLSANVGYAAKFVTLRSYIGSEEFMFRGSLFSSINVFAKQDFFSVTHLWPLKDHKFLTGTENGNAFFVQDYWEPRPLLYVVPGMRYDGEWHPKISIGFIPRLDMTVFSSLTMNEALVGLRLFDSSISAFRKQDNGYGVEARLVSPYVWGFRTAAACYAPVSQDSQLAELLDNSTIMLEYHKSLKKPDIGLSALADLNNLRLEIKIVDIRIFYRLQESSYSYGLSWEFWD
jgi:hypothetical protein